MAWEQYFPLIIAEKKRTSSVARETENFGGKVSNAAMIKVPLVVGFSKRKVVSVCIFSLSFLFLLVLFNP